MTLLDLRSAQHSFFFFFFFNDTATTEIYTLSLHDALPISRTVRVSRCCSMSSTTTSAPRATTSTATRRSSSARDRKSTRLNSSHGYISYAVFCLKKKKKQLLTTIHTRDKPLL